jgi:peptidylprolyl isomerase
MFIRPLAVLAAFLAAGTANAQTVKPAEAPAAAQPAAQPSGDPVYEAPDGTKLSVVKKSKVTITIDIEELRLGSGPECPPGATVMINYHGMLENGKVFDTTRGKKPVNFNLGQLILGWQLGIPGMKVGGVRRITIPYQLAYGEQEIPGQDGEPLIPAKSNLVFSIEMLAINGKDADGNPYPPKEKALSRVEKDNGLIIEELRIGDGAECPPGATVVCHYRGVLAVDGQQFDSSYDRGQPATFPLSNVIKGWQEGIPGMKIGGKRRLIIPAELAYGAMARPGIPANSMLEFEVELVDIKN